MTFNIKTPKEFLNISSGLCHSGCPSSERVDYASFFQKNKKNEAQNSLNLLPTNKEAMNICETSNLTDFYYDSCVFDLLSTGDRQFSVSAFTAMNDALRLDPKLRLRRENSVLLNDDLYTDDIKKSQSSSARTLLESQLILFALCLLQILLR